ncbi:MAG: hemerythrin domain-containing protein [Gammaproteobacteria bacterium]
MTRSSSVKTATRKDQSSSQNALEILKRDHQAVKKLFASYARLADGQDAEDSQKEELAGQICNALTVHAGLEEEIFYPALREALEDQAILDEAEVEHETAKVLIVQIRQMSASDDLFDAKVTVLGEYIDHHVAEEEGVMFEQAREADIDLEALGSAMEARRGALEEEVEAGADQDQDQGEDEDDDEDEDEEDDEDEEKEEEQDTGDENVADDRRRRA